MCAYLQFQQLRVFPSGVARSLPTNRLIINQSREEATRGVTYPNRLLSRRLDLDPNSLRAPSAVGELVAPSH